MFLWPFNVRQKIHAAEFIDMIHICKLPIRVPTAYQQLQYECSVLNHSFSFWRQWQCIIVLSWQLGIVMELSICTHKQMQNWLTLHNISWIVRFLFGNADEHEWSIIREQMCCRILHTLKISSSYKWSNAFSISISSIFLYEHLIIPHTLLSLFSGPGKCLENFKFNTFSHLDHVWWLISAGDNFTEGDWTWVICKSKYSSYDCEMCSGL